MSADADSSTPRPVFSRCPRCRYSLRGLPANHACPECGLRYDEDCALYGVTNPRVAIAVWLGCCSCGLFYLTFLEDLPSFGAIPVSGKIKVVAGLFLFSVSVYRIRSLIRSCCRWQGVAVTTDGLIISLANFDEKLIPWDRVGPAFDQNLPEGKAQIARVFLLDKNEQVHIGGLSNVFPTRNTVERFVTQVNERAKGGDAEPGTNDENIPS